MKNFYNENKMMIIIIGVIATVLPVFISIAMFFPIFGTTKGDANGWLSFWGSYLGGILSGVMTFLGVFMAFKLDRENNKKNLVRRNYNKTSKLFEWTNDLLQYLDDGESGISISGLYKDGESVLKGLEEVDTEWYLDALYIQNEVKESHINKKDNLNEIKNGVVKLHKDIKKYVGNSKISK